MEHIRWVLADAQATGRYGALMFLDLDNFKPLNDTHGHSVGDLLLRAVAGRLEACVREADFVGRFGGDEFVVVLGDLGLDEQGAVAAARALAQQILGSVSARYDLSVPSEGDEPLPVQHRCSVSIGLVLFPAAGMTEQGLLRQADAAMYQAKQAGRNTVRLAAAV
jgi:diguanylate cyclase (GGDEF)-like protein